MKATAPHPHSLRRRLLGLVLAAIALASLLQASSAYRTAMRQADALFDSQLQALARSIRGGVPFGSPGADESFDFMVQIWGPDGVQVFRSTGAALPAQAVLGFSDLAVDGVRYRVYSLRTAQQTVQIAQNLDERQARARGMALRAVLPVLLLAPLLMLAVWWLIDRSLAPVERMRKQVAGRAAEDLSPLPEAGLPAEVLPLLRELNQLFERARNAFAAQQRFVADAAHELRSPLTALKLQAQALRKPGDEAQREAAVARLNDGIDRAIRLAEQLLALALVESESPGASPPQRVDLQALVRNAVGDLLPQGRARRIDVGLATPEPVFVLGQPQLLEMLLRNLVDNAVKYSPEGGAVDVSLLCQDGAACIVVEDSGPGIAPAERERVFDRFYREAAAGSAGSGLGLSIVQAVASSHRASLRLESSQRLGGLRVEVCFPAGLSHA